MDIERARTLMRMKLAVIGPASELMRLLLEEEEEEEEEMMVMKSATRRTRIISSLPMTSVVSLLTCHKTILSGGVLSPTWQTTPMPLSTTLLRVNAAPLGAPPHGIRIVAVAHHLLIISLLLYLQLLW